jgi:hypothetical protein
VLVFCYCNNPRLFQIGSEFFDGTGGPTFRELIEAPAGRQSAEIKRPGGRPPTRAVPTILHEIAELSFMQHNSGHFLLDEFGGGFQIIEFFEGKFQTIDNYLMIALYARLDSESFDLGFDSSFVLQRYLRSRFVVAAGPLFADNRSHPSTLRLKWESGSFYVAENWLDPLDAVMKLEDVWRELTIDFYLLPIICESPSGKIYLSSIVTKRVCGDNFTMRFSIDGDIAVAHLGSNFATAIGNLYPYIVRSVLETEPELESAIMRDAPNSMHFNYRED